MDGAGCFVFTNLLSLFRKCLAMEVNDEPVRWAAAGDSVLLTLSGIDILQVR